MSTSSICHIAQNSLFWKWCYRDKGQKLSLNGVDKVTVCAGWDIKDARCDVDISAFMLDSSRKIISDDWFVFYGQTSSPDNSLKLNCNGTSHDDKCIEANLNVVNSSVSRIVFVLTIDEAEAKQLNFSMIDKAYIRILNGNNEMIRFMLSDYYDTVTAMMLGELYRHNGEWKFSAIGDGVKKDLAGLCEMYGVQTE
jgi:tellurium resistance protein TerD